MSDKKRFSYDTDREIYSAARVRALEALLIEKGVISDKTVDKVLSYFEKEMGPFNGAKIVARAWVDPAFKAHLLKDATSAIAEMKFPAGMAGPRSGRNKGGGENPQGPHKIILTARLCFSLPAPGVAPPL